MCPGCREPATEGQIRRNVVVEEAVTAWKLARCVVYIIHDSHIKPIQNAYRPVLLELFKQVENQKHQNASSKRKRFDTVEDDCSSDIEMIAGPSKTRGSATLAKRIPLTKNGRKGSARKFLTYITLYNLTERCSLESNEDEVQCPICSEFVPASRINKHIDNSCKMESTSTKRSEVKGQWNFLLGGESSGKPKSKGK